MIHSHISARRGGEGFCTFARAPLFALVAACSAGRASVGEFDRAAAPVAIADPARCDRHASGPGVPNGSSVCERISGYIAAGARFGSDERIGRPAPFAPPDEPGVVMSVRVSGGSLVEAPVGQGRLLLPAGGADEAE
jgi:hypothetical protein